jgi:hypothetical protein
MQILGIVEVTQNYQFRWPASTEDYANSILYLAMADDREHEIRIGFGNRDAYRRERPRVVIWIDNYPQAEFVGADDFDTSGEVLSEIIVPSNGSSRICRYQEEPIPERYMMFNTVGLPVRIAARGVHRAWAVVANIADHRTMIAVASLRRHEWWVSQQIHQSSK